eukprot:2255961-Amphidinium_carterae.1
MEVHIGVKGVGNDGTRLVLLQLSSIRTCSSRFRSMKAYVPKKGRSRMYSRPAGSSRVLKRPSACKYVRVRNRAPRHSREADR